MRSRRDILKYSAGLAVVPYLGGAAFGQNGPAQVVGVYRRGVGEMVITALLDGYLAIDPAMLTGSDPETNARLLAESFLPAGPVDTSINAFVIETGDRTILVDGGSADAFGPTAGKLAAALAAAGVTPERVDTVFATHLHPDHVGVFASNGVATFPNAGLATHVAEHAFWTDDGNFAGADDMVKGFAALAQQAVAPYAERLQLIEDGADIAPGVTAMHLPGHTPGHTGLVVSSGDQTLLIWADIVHVGPIQFARPDLTIPFDVDQQQAAETRARILDRVATDRLEIAGSHVNFPGFGHVAAAGNGGYRFVPSRWDHEL